jgi:8-amino-7-oxononanoate synthase
MADQLADIQERQLLRKRQPVERLPGGRIRVDGVEYHDLSSNDYLDLALDPRVRQAAIDDIEQNGWGAGASPLITGYSPRHAELEAAIARFESTEASILFPSGYASNLGTLSALAGPNDVLFSDARNHASLIDGCRLSKATVVIFDGRRPETLEAELSRQVGFERRFIVSDSVFSMDGDIAPLGDIVSLARRYDALTYIDEAHATGILGSNGRGAAELLGVESLIDIRMGTLSKALGSMGGFVVGDQTLIDWLVNRVRPYIFSTAFPSAAAAAALKGLEIIQAEPQRRQCISILAMNMKTSLQREGFDIHPSSTPIVPVIVGTPQCAVGLVDILRRKGFWTRPIRQPTVPAGTDRIRISLSASHSTQTVESVLAEVLHHGSARSLRGSSPKFDADHPENR